MKDARERSKESALASIKEAQLLILVLGEEYSEGEVSDGEEPSGEGEKVPGLVTDVSENMIHLDSEHPSIPLLLAAYEHDVPLLVLRPGELQAPLGLDSPELHPQSLLEWPGRPGTIPCQRLPCGGSSLEEVVEEDGYDTSYMHH